MSHQQPDDHAQPRTPAVVDIPRKHAGLGLLCNVCAGPCRIDDDPAPAEPAEPAEQPADPRIVRAGLCLQFAVDVVGVDGLDPRAALVAVGAALRLAEADMSAVSPMLCSLDDRGDAVPDTVRRVTERLLCAPWLDQF